jgi:hypothetical protein
MASICIYPIQARSRIPPKEVVRLPASGPAGSCAKIDAIDSVAAWTSPMKSDLSVGVRVRMSALGALRCARLANKTGTIVGGSVYVNSVSVLFDGNRSPSTIHREYVEVIRPALETTPDGPTTPS